MVTVVCAILIGLSVWKILSVVYIISVRAYGNYRGQFSFNTVDDDNPDSKVLSIILPEIVKSMTSATQALLFFTRADKFSIYWCVESETIYIKSRYCDGGLSIGINRFDKRTRYKLYKLWLLSSGKTPLVEEFVYNHQILSEKDEEVVSDALTFMLSGETMYIDRASYLIGHEDRWSECVLLGADSISAYRSLDTPNAIALIRVHIDNHYFCIPVDCTAPGMERHPGIVMIKEVYNEIKQSKL